MAVTDVRTQLLDALEREADEHGIDIVDVEVTGPSSAPIVRVRIDHADEEAPVISLDEVTEQTAWIDAVIDELDPVSGSYTLEVSSPGMDRPLRRPRDFERFAGEQVQVQTTATEGRRRFSGRLLGLREGNVVLSCDEGEVLIALEQIASAKIKPDYDAGKGQKKGQGKGQKKGKKS
jgi:ribosome maturation factor RimP